MLKSAGAVPFRFDCKLNTSKPSTLVIPIPIPRHPAPSAGIATCPSPTIRSTKSAVRHRHQLCPAASGGQQRHPRSYAAKAIRERRLQAHTAHYQAHGQLFRPTRDRQARQELRQRIEHVRQPHRLASMGQRRGARRTVEMKSTIAEKTYCTLSLYLLGHEIAPGVLFLCVDREIRLTATPMPSNESGPRTFGIDAQDLMVFATALGSLLPTISALAAIACSAA